MSKVFFPQDETRAIIGNLVIIAGEQYAVRMVRGILKIDKQRVNGETTARLAGMVGAWVMGEEIIGILKEKV